MPINIPLVTDYDGRGVKKAEKAFANLGKSTKALGSSLKSVFLPAAAAVAGLGAAGYSAVKAAMEDQAAQALLAKQLQISTKATKAQIAATENWISTTSLAVGVADDELRPAYASLVRVTKNATKAQKLLKIALNVSKGTGKSLSSVVQGLSRAVGGNVKALVKLDPSLKSFITKTTTADQAIAHMAKTFDGSASVAANTLQGRFARLNVALNEAKESIGAALLPIVERFARFLSEQMLPYIDKLVKAFQQGGLGGVLKTVGSDMWNATQNAKGLNGALLDLALTAGAVLAAFKGWSIFTTAKGAIDALRESLKALGSIFTTFASTSTAMITTALGLILLNIYVLIDALRDPIFRSDFGKFLTDSVKLVANAFIFLTNEIITFVNAIIRAVNLVKPGKDIPTFAKADMFKFSSDNVAQTPAYGTPRSFESSSVNITVNGGDPQATVDAITRWYRQNGATVPWMR